MACKVQNWKKVAGEENWDGLMNPLDDDLRNYVIHCGERVQAVGDAFNGEEASPWYGFSRYPPIKLFSMVGLQLGNSYKYKVTSFFYTLAEFDCPFAKKGTSTWMGYVAVATDEGKKVLGRRDIMICWRGTRTTYEWLKDFSVLQVSGKDVLGDSHDPWVHNGFHSLYTAKDEKCTYNKTSARDQVIGEVRRLVDLYRDEEISITVAGHSLGAALATLTGADIVANCYNKPTNQPEKSCPVTVVTFGGPHVGNLGFKNRIAELKDLHILRVVNFGDPVPHLLDVFFLLYFHVGEQLSVDTTKSPYLKATNHIENQHNLEIYMHGVAGKQGDHDGFKPVIERSISLINKDADMLKEKYHIPALWWVEKNKGMVQSDDGGWILDDYIPAPPTA